MTDYNDIPEAYVAQIREMVNKINDAIRPDIGPNPTAQECYAAIAAGQSALITALVYDIDLLASAQLIPKDLQPRLHEDAIELGKNLSKALNAQIILDYHEDTGASAVKH